MAVSRERVYSISELQLPSGFLKERPFETTGKLLRARQEKQDDSDHCRFLKHNFSKIPFEEDPSKIQEQQECEINIWSHLDKKLGLALAKKFAPHQMALERFQESMRTFLQVEARKLVQQPVEEMSEQERSRYFQILMEVFRDMKLIKLKALFRVSFLHEIFLRRIRSIGSEELEPLRNAILKTEEISQNFHQVLLIDREWTLETQFQQDIIESSLVESRDKVGELLEESVFSQGQLPSEDIIRYTELESRISFVLGLNIDFLDKLVNDELTSHWTLEEWILNFLSNNYDYIEDEDLKKDLSKELLIKLGFRDDSQAINTIMSRSAMLVGHVDPIELVKRFVKDELKYHPFFARELYLFPYTDQVCTHCGEIEFFDKKFDVMCMKTARVGDHEELYEPHIAKHIDGLRDEDSVILFHGTDHCSAIDILNSGIDINLGMPKHDFSDGIGFYMNDNYKLSETWSFSQTRKPAVLVFKVPKAFLEKSNCLDLSEEDKMSDWMQIVTEYRSGRPSRKLRNRLKTYDIIRGPISQPSGVAENKSFEPRENSHQVCVRNDDCADEIREFLDTVIFYE